MRPCHLLQASSVLQQASAGDQGAGVDQTHEVGAHCRLRRVGAAGEGAFVLALGRRSGGSGIRVGDGSSGVGGIRGGGVCVGNDSGVRVADDFIHLFPGWVAWVVVRAIRETC